MTDKYKHVKTAIESVVEYYASKGEATPFALDVRIRVQNELKRLGASRYISRMVGIATEQDIERVNRSIAKKMASTQHSANESAT